MNFIDTHNHLYLPEFNSDRDETVKRAKGAGIVKMLMPNIDIQSVGPLLSAEERYKGVCFSMMGLHPTSVKEDYLFQLDHIESLFNERKFIAVGEIGIDLYWDKFFLNEQIIAFRRQLKFAIEKNLPVAIHSRESFPEVFSVLEEFRGEKLNGVMHAFTGTVKDAEKAIDLGLYLGIGGIVTFKNSGLDQVIKETGPGNLVLETDAPYLAPAPFRGKRNESSFIPLINRKLAEIFGMNEEEIAAIIFENTVSLFSL